MREAFRPWEEGDSGPFFDLVAEDVRWTVIATTAASGAFESKRALISDRRIVEITAYLDTDLLARVLANGPGA